MKPSRVFDLTARQRRIIEKRHFETTGIRLFHKIAEEEGVSREYVRLVYYKGLNRLYLLAEAHKRGSSLSATQVSDLERYQRILE